jgi:hypothetical protein
MWPLTFSTDGLPQWAVAPCQFHVSRILVRLHLSNYLPLTHCFNTGDLELLEVSPPTSRFIARSVQFYDRGECVLVSYLESHEV